jgi:hypothetical protein
LDEEERKRKGLPPLTTEEAQERLQRYLTRIPYKLTKMRYSSFCRYFGHLKRLGWVEETGKTELSGIQDSYPLAPSWVYCRLTEAGKKSTLAEVSSPLRLLYPEYDAAYFKEKRTGKRYYSKKK